MILKCVTLEKKNREVISLMFSEKFWHNVMIPRWIEILSEEHFHKIWIMIC